MPLFAKKETSHAKGMHAEDLAQNYLVQQGYEIIHTRYKTKFGEIDVIAQKGNLICFVEVKMRQNIEDALHAITPKTRKRVEQSALYFLSVFLEAAQCDLRFDVVAITQNGRITHLDNAWEAGS